MKNKYLIGWILLLMGILMVAISSCTREEGCTVCTKVVYWEKNKDGIITSDTITSQTMVACSDQEREAYSTGDGTQDIIYYSDGYTKYIQNTTCE